MSKLSPSFYEFGPFRLDTVKRLLLREEEIVPLPPKAFDTLLALINNSGRVVEKSELMAAIWPDSFVEESNLTQNISLLRKALGERAGEHRYIVTIPGRGYRFVSSLSPSPDQVGDIIVERHAITEIVEEREESGPEGEFAPETDARHSPQVRLIRQARSARALVLTVVALALVLAAGFWMARRSPGPQSVRDVKSIAVLPIKTLGQDQGDENLGLGLADTLITRLSNLRQIMVRPTSAVLKYAGPDQDPLAAGRALGVEAILEGHMQQSDGRVRVAVQLIRVSDGSTIWAAKFEESSANLFRVQDSISQRVAEELSPALSGEERQRLAGHDTENPEAYQSYVKGRFWWNKRSPDGFNRAIEYFNQAIVLDANYALAYAGLADCYASLSPYEVGPRAESYSMAKAAAKRALEIDDQLAEAHTSLAYIAWLHDWDWAKAETEYRRAIELNPNYLTAHERYAVFLSTMARHEEALVEIQRAQMLDPASLSVSEDIARIFYFARQYDQAIIAALKSFELAPNAYRINGWLELAYQQKGLYDQSIETRLKAMIVAGANPEEVEALRAAYRQSGWKGFWQLELELTDQRAKQIYVSPYTRARSWARLGDQEQAIAWLEKAYAEHADHLVLLKVEPLFDGLRADPRFTNLLRRVGLAG